MEDTNKYLYEEEIGLEEENIVIYSGEGTSDYEQLINKPSINGILLMGDKTLDELGIKNGVTSYNELTDKPTIPTKTSELENDKGFITEIPSEYITEEELNTKGYITEIPTEYITEEKLNAKGYLTEYNETDPTVPQHVKNITTEDIAKWNSNTGGGTTTEYELPIASATTLGGVKIGNNLSIDGNGVLSATGGSSSGGTTNYTELYNKPLINGVELSGNKTLDSLGIQAKGDYATKNEVNEAIANAIGKALEGSY